MMVVFFFISNRSALNTNILHVSLDILTGSVLHWLFKLQLTFILECASQFKSTLQFHSVHLTNIYVLSLNFFKFVTFRLYCTPSSDSITTLLPFISTTLNGDVLNGVDGLCSQSCLTRTYTPVWVSDSTALRRLREYILPFSFFSASRLRTSRLSTSKKFR